MRQLGYSDVYLSRLEDSHILEEAVRLGFETGLRHLVDYSSVSRHSLDDRISASLTAGVKAIPPLHCSRHKLVSRRLNMAAILERKANNTLTIKDGNFIHNN